MKVAVGRPSAWPFRAIGGQVRTAAACMKVRKGPKQRKCDEGAAWRRRTKCLWAPEAFRSWDVCSRSVACRSWDPASGPKKTKKDMRARLRMIYDEIGEVHRSSMGNANKRASSSSSSSQCHWHSERANSTFDRGQSHFKRGFCLQLSVDMVSALRLSIQVGNRA